MLNAYAIPQLLVGGVAQLILYRFTLLPEILDKFAPFALEKAMSLETLDLF